MSEAVTLAPAGHLPTSSNQRRVVLVTGAAGNIGSYFAEHNRDRYQLRLMVQPGDEKALKLKPWGEVMEGDITDLEQMKKACDGIDTVVHLAANPSPNADWPSVLQLNIIGTYNAFVAAQVSGCRRFIYASSIHAVSGYPPDVQVKPNDPVNPGDLYGVSKCFGEALARYMAEQEGMSSICLRIGGFQPVEKAEGETGVSMLDAFVSQRDLDQLIRLCIDAEHLQFAIFNGLSDNRFKRLDITNAREILGYKPVDDTKQINAELQPLRLDERVHAHNVNDPGQKSGLRDQNVKVKA
jgi:hypothetical protein